MHTVQYYVCPISPLLRLLPYFEPLNPRSSSPSAIQILRCLSSGAYPQVLIFRCLSSGAYPQVLIFRCLSSGAYLQVLIFRYLSSGAYPQVLIFRCLSSVAYLQVLILRCLSSGVLTGTGVSNVVEPQLIFIFQRSLKLK